MANKEEPVGFTACWKFGFNRTNFTFGRCRAPKGHGKDLPHSFYAYAREDNLKALKEGFEAGCDEMQSEMDKANDYAQRSHYDHARIELENSDLRTALNYLVGKQCIYHEANPNPVICFMCVCRKLVKKEKLSIEELKIIHD